MQTDQVEYEQMAKIQTVVRYLWDATALICLENGPLRYTELHRTMIASTERYLSDSELTRTRHRLVRSRMISEHPTGNGGKAYCITEAGQARLRDIRVLLEIAPRLGPL